MSEEPKPGPNATVTLREITAKNLDDVCKLSRTLPERQNGLVANNAYSIAQAHYSDTAWFRAVYADETPVGFVMLDDDVEKQEYFLWRFMIGGEHQGNGYGRKAVERLVDYVKTRPGAKELHVSFVPKEHGPEKFYLKVGFKLNGQKYGTEIGATLKL